jgi:hypothetical protein
LQARATEMSIKKVYEKMIKKKESKNKLQQQDFHDGLP